eukprot:CAMPEP_0194503262 /NCGR_PEP_ID=MMETSP0253-20130528/28281_1 /TAXON_ID=2966 /ORGANISM="Noctiluca scintillans" /LENGTH=771 /DNA_ID=CAMNT_0039345533 /DNA_START=39 /DNA_END=2354 /DNA_ORIENTATION=-
MPPKRIAKKGDDTDDVGRVRELAGAVSDMERAINEKEANKKKEELRQKREVSMMKRRIQSEIKKTTQEVKAHDTEAAELRKAVQTLEKAEGGTLQKKQKSETTNQNTLSKVKTKENEKTVQLLERLTAAGEAKEKLAHLNAALKIFQPLGFSPGTRDQALADSPRQRLKLDVAELVKRSESLRQENVALREELKLLLEQADGHSAADAGDCARGELKDASSSRSLDDPSSSQPASQSEAVSYDQYCMTRGPQRSGTGVGQDGETGVVIWGEGSACAEVGKSNGTIDSTTVSSDPDAGGKVQDGVDAKGTTCRMQGPMAAQGDILKRVPESGSGPPPDLGTGLSLTSGLEGHAPSAYFVGSGLTEKQALPVASVSEHGASQVMLLQAKGVSGSVGGAPALVGGSALGDWPTTQSACTDGPSGDAQSRTQVSPLKTASSYSGPTRMGGHGPLLGSQSVSSPLSVRAIHTAPYGNAPPVSAMTPTYPNSLTQASLPTQCASFSAVLAGSPNQYHRVVGSSSPTRLPSHPSGAATSTSPIMASLQPNGVARVQSQTPASLQPNGALTTTLNIARIAQPGVLRGLSGDRAASLPVHGSGGIARSFTQPGHYQSSPVSLGRSSPQMAPVEPMVRPMIQTSGISSIVPPCPSPGASARSVSQFGAVFSNGNTDHGGSFAFGQSHGSKNASHTAMVQMPHVSTFGQLETQSHLQTPSKMNTLESDHLARRADFTGARGDNECRSESPGKFAGAVHKLMARAIHDFRVNHLSDAELLTAN